MYATIGIPKNAQIYLTVQNLKTSVGHPYVIRILCEFIFKIIK